MKIENGDVVLLSDGRKGKVSECGHSTFTVLGEHFFYSGEPLFGTSADKVTVLKRLLKEIYPEEYL